MAPAGTNAPNVEGAIYVLDTRVMRDVAQALGDKEDADLYGQEFDRVRAAYNSAYFDDATSSYKPMTQANQAMPLAFGIVPGGKEQSVVNALVADIAAPAAPKASTKFGPAQANHITAGDIGTLFVWQTLGDYGHSDLAQTMITQPDVPSYLNMINSGETTITENWDTKSTTSHNHDRYSGIFAWFYRSLAGISATKPGYEEFQIKPDLTTALTHVHCTYNSVRGLIGSDWERQDGQLKLKVIVPVNSTATVYIPAHDADSVLEGGQPAKQAPGVKFLHMDASTAIFSVGSGEYAFQSSLP
jgi:alpha-L-rhamnosidase